jgi:hypothetical protein
VTEGHRGGDAGFAGEDLAAVFSVEQTQVEEVAHHAGAFDLFSCEGGQAERLRHFAGTGLIVPGRAADEQHPALACRIVVLAFGLLDPVASVQPLDRQLELGICETRSGFSGARALVILVVCRPGEVDNF